MISIIEMIIVVFILVCVFIIIYCNLYCNKVSQMEQYANKARECMLAGDIEKAKYYCKLANIDFNL